MAYAEHNYLWISQQSSFFGDICLRHTRCGTRYLWYTMRNITYIESHNCTTAAITLCSLIVLILQFISVPEEAPPFFFHIFTLLMPLKFASQNGTCATNKGTRRACRRRSLVYKFIITLYNISKDRYCYAFLRYYTDDNDNDIELYATRIFRHRGRTSRTLFYVFMWCNIYEFTYIYRLRMTTVINIKYEIFITTKFSFKITTAKLIDY